MSATVNRWIRLGFCVCILTGQGYGAETHADKNPVYQQLIESGPPGLEIPIVEPILSDTGDRSAAIEEVVPANKRERFFRGTIVAPHIIKISSQQLEGDRKLRTADFWFAAKGRLDDMKTKEFLESLRDTNRDSQDRPQTALVVTNSDLAKLDIEYDAQHESFAHASQRLLKRVDIATTSRNFWSQSDHSIVVASFVDPRFQELATFANRWAPLIRQDDGTLNAGDEVPYAGAGGYVKATQLSDPEGFLFIEGHLIFAEPQGWFSGANLLGSKMPAIVQAEVRSIRRLLARSMP